VRETHEDQESEDYLGQPEHLGSEFEENDEQVYDDPPRARRHGALATAVALIGCAMLGTAGAYGYRSYYHSASVTQPPPVIAADSSSNKIVPAPNDSQSGKTVQDRLANAGKEQIVSKQEEPVALKDLGTPTAPRVVLPAPVAPGASTAPPQGSAGGGTSANEPKKVRTVTIRSDGSDMSGRPVGAGTTSRTVPPPKASTQATQNGTEPLSLEPQTREPASAPPARIRTATAPASASRSQSTASSGGFLVQLSSQKSESEAVSSFHSLQSRFPSELGGRQAVIRRADLGAKGVFYRTMVGPFPSAQEAAQFCANLKAAGASCVVPNN
jgi:hypothetical protein